MYVKYVHVQEYSISALVGSNAAVSMHMASPQVSRYKHYDRGNMDSNKVLLSNLIKKTLKWQLKYKLTKITRLFRDKLSRTLQNKVIFNVIYQIGRCGNKMLEHEKGLFY